MTPAASAILIQLLFPLWLPVWQERPLTEADLRPGPYANSAAADAIAKAGEGFAFAGPEIRARLAVCLRRTRDPQAVKLLVDRLPLEKNRGVRATILEQLALADPALVPPAALQPWLRDSDPDTAAAAVRAYGRLADANLQTVRQIAADTAAPDAVRLAAWEALAARPGAVSPAFLGPQLTETDPRRLALILRGALRPDLAPAARARLDAAVAESAPQEVRLALAENLATAAPDTAAALSRKLSRDPLAGIRAATAASLGELPAAAETTATLLSLLQDPDALVRLNAVRSLAATKPAQVDVPARIAALFADSSLQVRLQAEDTLLALQSVAAVPAAAAGIESPNPQVRFHSLNTLAKLKAKDRAAAVTARLPRETEPELLAAAMEAAGVLSTAADCGAAVIAQAAHASPLVRAAAAGALGRLREPNAVETLQTLSADAAPEVRLAAIVAMGRFPDARFAPTLLDILKRVSGNNPSSPDERMAACWAAGRIRPVDKGLLDRVVTQSTTPVIPTPIGPMFEGDALLANAAFALALAARDDARIRPQAERTLTLMSTTPDAAPNPRVLQPSAEIREAARQARAMLEGGALSQELRPTDSVVFPYVPATMR